MYAVFKNRGSGEFLVFDRGETKSVNELCEAQLFVVEHLGFGHICLRAVGGPHPGDVSYLLDRLVGDDWDLKSVEIRLAEPARYVG